MQKRNACNVFFFFLRFHFRLCLVNFRTCALPRQLTDVCRSGFTRCSQIFEPPEGAKVTWFRGALSFFSASTMSAGTPKSLPSSGQKSIQDICHPLSAEESVLTPSPDAANTSSSIGHKVSGCIRPSIHPSAQGFLSCLLNTADWKLSAVCKIHGRFARWFTDLTLNILLCISTFNPCGFISCLPPLNWSGNSIIKSKLHVLLI